MYIVHESMQEEAAHVAELFGNVLGLTSTLVERDLSKGFIYLPKFDGYASKSSIWNNTEEVFDFLGIQHEKAALVLTPRDRYAASQSKEDDWVFGTNHGDVAIVNTARMRRYDNQPSKKLDVPDDVYKKRVSVLALHEIGHRAVKASHFKLATWVNIQKDYKLWLGNHCTDNTCVMYEIVDIQAPSPAEGHMLLGEEKKYDAGLDNLIERLNPNWFCDLCTSAIQLSDAYT